MLVKLFLAFFKIGLFAIGGAYSFLPIIEREVVEKYGWLTKEEFLDILGVAKIFPGAISIKYATYTGYKMAGILGAVVANLGNILVPALLILFVSGLYLKYKDLPVLKGAFHAVELAVFAMIIAVGFQLINASQFLHLKSLLVLVLSLLLFIFTKVHPALIIILAGLIGAVWR